MISRNILQNMLNIMRITLMIIKQKGSNTAVVAATMGKSKELTEDLRKTVDLYKLGSSLGAISSSCRFQDFNNCRHKQLYIRGNKTAPPRGNRFVQKPQRLNHAMNWKLLEHQHNCFQSITVVVASCCGVVLLPVVLLHCTK